MVATLAPPGALGPITATSADLLPAGALDPTFDGDGIALTDISSVVEAADAERQVVGGGDRILVLTADGDEVWRLHPDGTRDGSFGDDLGATGVRRLNLPFAAERLAVASDGSYYVGGYTPSGLNEGVRVARFSADGTRDFGFGLPVVASDGQAAPACPDGPFTQDRFSFTGFADLGVRTDGSVVVTGPGTSETGTAPDGVLGCSVSSRPAVVVARLSAAGATLAVGGKALFANTVRPSALVASGNSVLVSIATRTSTINGGGFAHDVGVVRFAPALEPDAGFGIEGVAVVSQTPDDGELPIVVDGGTVAVAVESRFTPIDDGPARPSWRVHTWNATTGAFQASQQAIWPIGSSTTLRDLDVTFVTGGGGELLRRFVVVGQVRASATAPAALGVARLDLLLGPDAGVATAVSHPGPPPTTVGAAALVRLGDGSMRIAGVAGPEVPGLDDHRLLLLSRLAAGGGFDGAFGPENDGFVVHHGGNEDQGRGVVVRPDGRIVAVGRIGSFGPAGATGFVLRHEEAGPLDPTFSPTGRPGVEITRYPGDVPVAPPFGDIALVAPAATAGTSISPGGLQLLAAEAELGIASVELLVENDDDAGPGSFREAIEQASAQTEPVTVTFTDAFDITLTGGQVVYTGDQDLTLQGSGSTIDGAGSDRILLVTDDVALPSLHLEDLTFQGGSTGDQGGAIASTGHVIAISSTFVGNEATAGGAIHSDGAGVDVIGSTFIENSGGGGCGGAIVARGTVRVSETSGFDANRAACGGAILAQGDVLVVDSAFTGNEADEDAGGAILASAPDPVTVTIERSTLADNTAAGDGGAISASGSVSVLGASFLTGNQARNGGAIRAAVSVVVDGGGQFVGNVATGAAFPVGGAILSDGPVRVVGSTFRDNGQPHAGGAVFARGDVEVDGSLFEGNEVTFNGGAIYAQAFGGTQATVTVTSSSFVGNGSPGDDGDGGAIRVEGRVVVDGSTFAGNHTAHGGSIAAFEVAITDSEFLGNHAAFYGGAVWASDVIEVEGATFQGNTIGTDDGSFFGAGAIRAYDDVFVTDSSFLDNLAVPGIGGAIEADGDVTVIGSTFANNLAEDGGGAIHAIGTVTAINSTFALNTAEADGDTADGGAIWAFAIELVHVTVAGNVGLHQLFVDDGVIESFGSLVAHPQDGENCSDTATVSSYSYDTDGTCEFVGEGDLPPGSGDPVLRDLEPNGGPTLTMRPELWSPLVDAIPLDACDADVDTDQRGEPRPFGSGCDIGAVEQARVLDIAVEGLAEDAEGRLLIAGSTAAGTTMVLHRLLPNGGPDPSFGAGVPFLLGLAPYSSSVLRDVAVDDQGRIVAVGEFGLNIPGVVSSGPLLAVVRLLPDGSPDPGFGTDGVVPVPGPGGADSSGHGIAIDADRRLVVTGWAEVEEASRGLLVARLRDDGSLDPTFGTGGTVLGPQGYEGRDVTTDGNEVVVVGNGPGWEGPFAFVARYLATGTLDAGFGEPLGDPASIPDAPPGPGFGFPFGQTIDESRALGVVLDAVGNLVIAGQRDGDLAVARLTATGVPDATFAGGQAVTTDVGGDAAGAAVTIAPDGKIVVAGHVTDARGTRVVVARYLPGVGVLECTPAAIDFGAPLVGETVVRSATCTVTAGTVRVSEVRVEPSNPVDFGTTADTCTDATLRLGERCRVRTRFAPQVAGPQSAALVVEYVGTQGGGQLAGVGLRGATTVPADDEEEGETDPEPSATLTVDPEEGQIGTEVEATGSGFDPGVAVQLRLDEVPVGTVPAAAVTASGFTSTFTVPEATPGGDRSVTGCQRCGTATELAGSATFTVTPQLFLDRPLARPGDVVVATGDGFPASTPVRLTWDRGLGVTTALADGSGAIRAPVLVFRRDVTGVRELQARISEAEDIVAETPFLVVPGSIQPGNFAGRR
ncbi:delta-60 repeat domain-containing protein [Nitriliruptor alkaliphilus]|uniref:delta-60 repeat domain-containing protein n=1 Tax=Nitriliruptor alkaliphilus TaxID=427918 RepID=UPI0006960E24|nr:delta-60 repeat domain-containing protein [Nitriliruptor alkaliphilus]